MTATFFLEDMVAGIEMFESKFANALLSKASKAEIMAFAKLSKEKTLLAAGRESLGCCRALIHTRIGNRIWVVFLSPFSGRRERLERLIPALFERFFPNFGDFLLNLHF